MASTGTSNQTAINARVFPDGGEREGMTLLGGVGGGVREALRGGGRSPWEGGDSSTRSTEANNRSQPAGDVDRAGERRPGQGRGNGLYWEPPTPRRAATLIQAKARRIHPDSGPERPSDYTYTTGSGFSISPVAGG